MSWVSIVGKNNAPITTPVETVKSGVYTAVSREDKLKCIGNLPQDALDLIGEFIQQTVMRRIKLRVPTYKVKGSWINGVDDEHTCTLRGRPKGGKTELVYTTTSDSSLFGIYKSKKMIIIKADVFKSVFDKHSDKIVFTFPASHLHYLSQFKHDQVAMFENYMKQLYRDSGCNEFTILRKRYKNLLDMWCNLFKPICLHLANK